MTDINSTAAGPRRIDYALLLAVAVLWGGSYSFIKLGVATIPPLTLIAARTLIAGAILLAVLRLRGVAIPRDPALLSMLAVQAVLQCALPFTLIAWGQQEVDAALATILNSTTPVFAFLITWLITRHEPATARKLAGVAIGLGGVCMIVGLEALNGIGERTLAQLAIVGATVSYGCAAVFAKRFKSIDPMLTAAGALIFAGLMLLPLSLAVDRPWTLEPSWSSLVGLGMLSVFSTALAFSIYFSLLARIGTIATTAQAYLRVPAGVAIAMLLFGEQLSLSALGGFAAVMIGVIAMTLPARRVKAAEMPDVASTAPKSG